MKDTLQEIFDKLGQSEPKFTSSMRDGDLLFSLKDEYDPKTADVDHSDPVTKLILANYSESFDKHGKQFVKSTRALESTQRDIFNLVKRAFVNASPLKNPQQSKLYKWFEFGKINSHARREGLISLYRYVESHVDAKSSRFKGGPDNVHAKNLVAILEKMKEKHEQQE